MLLHCPHTCSSVDDSTCSPIPAASPHLTPTPLSLAFPDSVNCYPLETVPSTTLCVILLRQPLRTSLQRREIQASSETVFIRSKNLLVGLFNVDFDFFVFFRMRALELQLKIFCGFLLSLATSIFLYALVMLAYQLIVKNISGCNRLCPLDL